MRRQVEEVQLQLRALADAVVLQHFPRLWIRRELERPAHANIVERRLGNVQDHSAATVRLDVHAVEAGVLHLAEADLIAAVADAQWLRRRLTGT